MVLDKINIDFESHDYLPEEKETYQVGEEINKKIKEFIIFSIEKGDLRNNLERYIKKQWDYQKSNF